MFALGTWKRPDAVIRERGDPVADVVDNLFGHIPSAGDPSHGAVAPAHFGEGGAAALALRDGQQLKQTSSGRLSS